MKAFRRFCHGDTLEDDLWQLTETGYVEAPSHLLQRVVKASSDPDDRHVIMRHLQEHLSISSNWRSLLGGLVLLGELVKDGPSMLFVEICNGYHFDPVQRLSFLEQFRYAEDQRVQRLIRNKATRLRSTLMEKMHGALDSDLKHDQSLFERRDPTRRPDLVDGLVMIGHKQDTDSEDEGTKTRPASTVSTHSGGDHLVEGEWCCVESHEPTDLLDLS